MADKFDDQARELEAANPTGDMAVRVAGILRAASFNACEAATGILGEVRERSFLEGRAIGHEEGLAQGRAERDGQDHSRPTQAILDAAQMVTRLWADFTSQEMYGEFMRGGMAPHDFEHMETEMQALRVAMRECEAAPPAIDPRLVEIARVDAIVAAALSAHRHGLGLVEALTEAVAALADWRRKWSPEAMRALTMQTSAPIVVAAPTATSKAEQAFRDVLTVLAAPVPAGERDDSDAKVMCRMAAAALERFPVTVAAPPAGETAPGGER